MTDTIHRRWAEFNRGEAADAALYQNELKEKIKRLTAENEQLRKEVLTEAQNLIKQVAVNECEPGVTRATAHRCIQVLEDAKENQHD